jgi:hypothetical protein
MARMARAEVFAADEVAVVHVMNRVVRRCSWPVLLTCGGTGTGSVRGACPRSATRKGSCKNNLTKLAFTDFWKSVIYPACQT